MYHKNVEDFIISKTNRRHERWEVIILCVCMNENKNNENVKIFLDF